MGSRFKILLVTVQVFLVCSLGAGSSARAREIAVIVSRRIPPFEVAYQGFRSVVKHPLRVFNLAETGQEAVVNDIHGQDDFHLIFAIGSRALRFALDNFPHKKIVFTMVSHPERIVGKKRSNVTGIRMETPWYKMFEYLDRITHRHKKVGIIVNPKRMDVQLSQIMEQASEHDIQPIIVKVDNVSEALSEFKNLEGKIDAFLMVPDPYIFTPQFYEYILLSSFRHKFVLVGLSPKYTRAGSLFSLVGDNRDWGVQAGLTANKIMRGTSPEDIPYRFAGKYLFSLNLKTARTIGIVVPRFIQKKADYVVE